MTERLEDWNSARVQARWPMAPNDLLPRERWLWWEQLWSDVLRAARALPTRGPPELVGGQVQVEAMAALAAWVERYDSGEWDDPPGKLALLYDLERVAALLRGGRAVSSRPRPSRVRAISDRRGLPATTGKRAAAHGRGRSAVGDRSASLQAASRRRAFCTDGNARLGLGERPRADVDARRLGGDRDLLAGGRVAPGRFLVAGLTRRVSWTRPPIRTFCALPISASTTSSSAASARLASALVMSARSATALASCVWVRGTALLSVDSHELRD